MMDEEPAGPLTIDLRLILESLVSGLAFLLAAIAAVDLVQPWDVLAPLAVGAAIVMINRLLGRSHAAAIGQVQVTLDRAIAANTVLKTEASPALKRAAEEAGEAVRPITATVKKEEK